MVRSLPATIESVLGQDFPHIEFVVIDGASNDGTLALLERYKGRLGYVSEPDNGPSEAIYKGLSEARGDILAWLNADDTYEPGAVRRAVEFLSAHPEIDIVYGDGWWIDEQGHRIRPYPSLAFDPHALKRDCFICQPAAFFRAAAYRRCPIDPTLKASFDYDLWIRMASAGLRFAYLPVHLANSRMHQGSQTLYARDLIFRSSMALLARHYNYVPFSWVFGYAAFRIDGRDQFFEPLQPSLIKYFATLPLGLWYNRRQPFRYLGEWLGVPWKAARSRLRHSEGAGQGSAAKRPAQGDKMSLL